MFKKVVAGVGLAILAGSVHADFNGEISGEIGFGRTDGEIDFGSSESDFEYDADELNFLADFYFQRVSTENVPIREAGFLSKYSSLRLSREYSEIKPQERRTLKTMMLEVGGRVVIPDTPVILGLGFLEGEFVSGSFEEDIDGFFFSVGRYLFNNGALIFSYKALEAEEDGDKEKAKYFTVEYKQVNHLGRNKFLAFDAHIQQQDISSSDDSFDVLEFGGGVIFYPLKKLGVGASLTTEVVDESGYENVTAVFSPKITYDVNNNFGFQASLESLAGSTEYPLDGEEVEVTGLTFKVGATGRF